MTFLWPWILILLPLPWLIRWWNTVDNEQVHAIELPPALAESMAEISGQSGSGYGLAKLLLNTAWIGLIVAASQPQLTVGDPISLASGRSVILVVDLSRSMEKQDFLLDEQSLNRLQAVKNVASDFIQKRQGDRIGLILFGDEAFVANPMSFDLAAAKYALNESAIGMAGRTTALGDALGLAIVKLRQDSAKEKAIILLTDGRNNAGQADPLHAAEVAAEWGIKIHTVGMGSEATPSAVNGQNPSADLDTKTLKAISLLSSGSYFRARTLDDLKSIYSTIDEMLSDELPAPPLIPRQDLRQLPLLLSLIAVIAVIAIRIKQGLFPS